jgi:transaldolase
MATGTKLWLDSVDPNEVAKNRAWGASGATSNPIIVGDLIKTGRFDEPMSRFIRDGLKDEEIAWRLTDMLVSEAQQAFLPAWQATHGDDGYVSFELDPLLEDPERSIPEAERTRRYIALGKQWGIGRRNRMIKVPATPGGIAALEELCAAGVTLNVTLVFSERQYEAARDAIWRGAQRRKSQDAFKSVYSIFVSRLDVYTEKHVPQLSAPSPYPLPPGGEGRVRGAQGMVGIVNAKRIWRLNQEFWSGKKLPLKQEMIFASTGTKRPEDPPWKYVEAFAGSDIETNPPATNEAVQATGRTFTRQVDKLPPKEVLDEIDREVDMEKLERTLMQEGIKKFADPQHALLALIAHKRAELSAPVGR